MGPIGTLAGVRVAVEGHRAVGQGGHRRHEPHDGARQARVDARAAADRAGGHLPVDAGRGLVRAVSGWRPGRAAPPPSGRRRGCAAPGVPRRDRRPARRAAARGWSRTSSRAGGRSRPTGAVAVGAGQWCGHGRKPTGAGELYGCRRGTGGMRSKAVHGSVGTCAGDTPRRARSTSCWRSSRSSSTGPRQGARARLQRRADQERLRGAQPGAQGGRAGRCGSCGSSSGGWCRPGRRIRRSARG